MNDTVDAIRIIVRHLNRCLASIERDLDNSDRPYAQPQGHNYTAITGPISSNSTISLPERRMSSDEEYYSINDVCRKFKLSPSTVYKKIYSKEIPAVKFGRCWKIPKSSLDL